MERVVPSQVVDYLDTRFPQATKINLELDKNHAPELTYLLWMLDHLPEHLITLSGREAAEFGESKSAIWLVVERWKNGERGVNLNSLQNQQGHPLSLLRKHLGGLRDEGVEPSTPTLGFIKDTPLREELRRDLTAVNRCLSDGLWKSSTVLAGSIVEAFLLYAVGERRTLDPGSISSAWATLVASKTLKASPPADMNDWRLVQLIEVAYALRLISKDSWKLCDVSRNYRNLIHPGVSVRTAQVCDRGTALAAVSAVERIIVDFS